MSFSNIIFLILFIALNGYFFWNVKKLFRNMQLGKNINRSDQKGKRWTTMLRIALGQGKMTKRPIAGILHIIVYLGFLIINLEMLEIIIDGIFGTHRYFASLIGNATYSSFTTTTEVLALLVIVAVVIFYIRRNVQYIKRFRMPEMKGWPKDDANIILMVEFALMFAFLLMNASDYWYMQKNPSQEVYGHFPISVSLFSWALEDLQVGTLHFIERAAWWFHIIGILLFLNYLYWSKHLHILLAFPNTWFANLQPKGKLNDLESVTREVKLMMDPNADPFAAPVEGVPEPEKFGASDIFDLNKVQLLNAYTCTECGRCTAECPANLTGKKLSPRAIMMKVRDRVEEVGKNIDKNGEFQEDGKQLLNDYITPEELWACTSCNACVEACPILIDPLSIIIDMRRYLVMEQSAAPQELNMMMNNIENNGAPWQFNQQDRLNWAKDE